jgi:HPt (histidine-containing phosphotransfer) domain-containing protein
MDMRMPQMDGLEATRAIRALGGAMGRVPIIALTANAFADDIKACRDAGMDEFIAKPVRKKMLAEKLANLLARHPYLQNATHAKAGPPERDIKVDDTLPVTPPAEVALEDVVPALDRAALDLLIEEIGSDGVRATLDVFLTETVERLARLGRLSCEEDRAKIRGEAHTLKGSSATFGLSQIADLARTLEYSAPQITPDDYRDLLDRLDAGFDVARDELAAAMTESVG